MGHLFLPRGYPRNFRVLIVYFCVIVIQQEKSMVQQGCLVIPWFRFTAAVTAKALIYQLLHWTVLCCLPWMVFTWFHKLFHWRKKTVANVDACVRFCNRKKQTLVRYREFLGFYYKQIIAWPLSSIWQPYRLVTFQNFPNTTDRLAARGILDNFEISLA